MSVERIKDEAVVQTLVYINEIARCNCTCHGRKMTLMDDTCCRYPGWWPVAPSLQDIVFKIRGERCPHCGQRVQRSVGGVYVRVSCHCGWVVRRWLPFPSPRA